MHEEARRECFNSRAERETWIKGSETYRQHNHCMIGAINLARRRLNATDDRTKHLVQDAIYRETRRAYSSIEMFNDNPHRRFKSVRKIMLVARREAFDRAHLAGDRRKVHGAPQLPLLPRH